LAVLFIVTCALTIYPHVSVSTLAQREVALWIGEGYFNDPIISSNIHQLENDIVNHHVSYLFTFFASIREDGTIGTDVEQSQASPVISALHAYNVKIIAVMDGWGPNFPGIVPAGYVLHLSNPAVRSAIAASAASLITFGFDGVQLDIEGVACGVVQCQGADYVKLVSEVRQRINGAVGGFVPYFSVDLPPRTGSVCDDVNPWIRWADYAGIAQYVNAIIPMAYDSNFVYWLCASSTSYGEWVRAVANYALDSVRGTGASVLIGVPTGRMLEPLNAALNQLSTISAQAFLGVTVFMYQYGSGQLGMSDWKSIDKFLLA